MNVEIKAKIKESRIKQYEIAEYIGITETNFSRWFRKPLTDEQKKKITDAIKVIKEREKYKNYDIIIAYDPMYKEFGIGRNYKFMYYNGKFIPWENEHARKIIRTDAEYWISEYNCEIVDNVSSDSIFISKFLSDYERLIGG